MSGHPDERPGRRRPVTAGERHGADQDRPGTVYRSRPRPFRRGKDGMAGLRVGGGPADRAHDETRAGAPPAADPGVAGGPPGPGPGGYDRWASASVPPGPGDGFRGGPPPAARPGLSDRPPAGGGPRRRHRRRPWRGAVALVVVLLLAYPIAVFAAAWTNITKVAALPEIRAADQPGRTYLVVGSDSRQGLTKEQRKRLATGKIGGQRTDTIMLLHVPARGGPTVLVSVPRDSYVAIPGHGKNKINAAYAFGGPQLLVRTVERATGLTIDEYVETGLGGYADLVDAIGGVEVCSPRAFTDKKAGVTVRKGCQDMDGATALGYARARYSDPRGDLGRVERQRQVLAAIAGKTLSPGVVLAPWRALPAASAGGAALVVDDGTTPIGLARFILAMRAVSGGDGLSLTVPIGNASLSTSAGEAVSWNTAKAERLFTALKNDDTEAVRPLAQEQERKTG